MSTPIIFPIVSSHDQDAVLGFFLSLIGPATSVLLLYRWMLAQTDLYQGLGWWLLAFFSLEYWGWLAMASIWLVGVRWLLPQTGFWGPAVGMAYGAALLSFMFYVSWQGAILTVGGGVLIFCLLLRYVPKISPLVGLVLFLSTLGALKAVIH